MIKFLNKIKIFLITIIIIGFLTAGIDYLRMTSGDVPIFNLSSYAEKERIQTYRGLFYVAERKVTVSTAEPLVDSKDMKYKILVFDVEVPRQFKEVNEEFTIVTNTIANCTEESKLYFADEKVKIYTYCLESIKVNKDNKEKDLIKYLEKDSSIIDDIDSKLDYTGLYKDRTTLVFRQKEDSFTSQGITMYRCNKENINDVYLAPENTPFKDDFCTYKNDDLKFMFEIIDESTDKELKEEKEIFYEDENYKYEFDKVKSQYIFIKRPATRGRTEVKFPLKVVLDNKALTMEDLKNKGLEFNTIDKNAPEEQKEG